MTTDTYQTPSLSGFIAWTRAVMGIPTQAIPDNDPGYQIAYEIALEVRSEEHTSELQSH